MKNEDTEFTPKRRRADSISQDMDTLMEKIVLPSKILEEKEKKKPVEIEEDEYYANDEWMAQLSMVSKVRANRKLDGSLFDEMGTKKKKKKKKKGTDLTDYAEMFHSETSLLENTLKKQMQFTDSIQRKYDIMESQKSSSRGVGKFTTDLISAITSSRSLSKDILRDLIATKKTIAELSMKEKEKLKAKNDENSDDLIGFSSKFLKGLTSTDRRSLEQELGEIYEVDNDDELFDSVNSAIMGSSHEKRSEESNLYLKYEGRKVTVKARYNDATGDSTFYAEDADGNIIDDYPVPPDGTKLTVNRSTMIGTDSYGQKFPIELE